MHSHSLRQQVLSPTTFTQTNLISDGSPQAGPARQTDPNLINPWGVAYSATGPFWISENNSGVSSIDSVTASGVTLNVIPPVTIAPPTTDSGSAAPTGQVFNSLASTGAFMLQDGSPASFLFATEDGTISGWNPAAGTQSIIAVNESANPADGDEAQGVGAVYKGLAIADTGNGPMLYAANFRHGTVDVYDQNFNAVNSFTDTNLPAGYAPFNVQVLDGKLFVTFALQDDAKHDDVAGPGNGFVDEFDLQGHLLARVASGGSLDSPWGLAIAPSSFGTFGGDLLVGNFGDGTIEAYNLKNDQFVGNLTDASGNPIVIPDLWELIPGNNGSAGNSNTIYFTAGVQDEMHGLFGSLTANPTSSPVAMTGAASHHMTG
ncbi:MAG TPA: TIGR03118 family protein [Acetobacteraceae bacterium]